MPEWAVFVFFRDVLDAVWYAVPSSGFLGLGSAAARFSSPSLLGFGLLPASSVFGLSFRPGSSSSGESSSSRPRQLMV